MKITCQSCQAKYTIADEKVAGKTVKIKCKKCGAAIVVHGNELSAQPAPAGAQPPRPTAGADDEEGETRVFTGGESHGASAGADEWTVNVSDDEQRPMSTAQVVEEFRRGVLTADSYVWKDGMTDWLPLSSVPEFASLRNASAPPAAAAAANPFAGVTSPLAAAPAAASSSPAAARRQGGRSANVNLFGSVPKEEPPPVAPPMSADRLVGERNENSVLFSLAALTAAETAAKVQKKDDVSFDMRSAGKNNGRGGFDDIMNLGGGGLGGPMLAPPPLLAPVVEAPPPPALVAPVAMQPDFGMPFQQPKKSNMALVIGILGGMAIMGVTAVFLFRPAAPLPTTPETTTTATTQPTTTAAATTEPVATTAQPTSTAPTDTAATAATDKPKDKPAVVAGGPGPGVKPVDKPTDKPTDKPADKPAETAPTDKPADKPAAPAEAGKEFNRGAATSALGAAAGAAKACKKADGPTGSGKVKVTFAPSGNVTSAQVQGAPFAGTSVGGCIAGAFRSAKVPPFDGSPVSVSKSFTIN